MESQEIDLNSHVMLRRELLAKGFTDRDILSMVRSGDMTRFRYGALMSTAVWESLSDADRHRAHVRAVLRRAHPTAVASHISAAIEHGASVWGVPLDEVHVTRTDGRAGRREAGVVHHRGAMKSSNVVTVGGIRTTSPVRSAVEVTAMTTVEPALVVVNSLLHAKKFSLEDFHTAAESYKHWPRTLTTGIVERLCGPWFESVAESRFDFLCWDCSLPRATPQIEVYDELGRLVGRVDFGWPDLGVFVEVDGREKYFRYRRPGETLEDYLMREKAREELISQITGWICIRITWADLENPARTAARLRRILASRRPVGA